MGQEGQLVVVTGMTGAGRSTAAKELEDLGFYVMDNLPPDLLKEAVTALDQRFGHAQPIAAVIDVRAGRISEKLLEVLGVGFPGRRVTVLFLEADDDVLIRRQDAARRPHPLQGLGRLADGIQAERLAMESVRAESGLLIDTTELNPHQLKAKVAEAFGSPDSTRLRITVLSFGFKYGVPIDADMIADMRFLPNPFWHPALRDKTGKQAEVADFVKSQPGAEEFLTIYLSLLETVCAGYLREGKRFLTLGIGCTGGKHRSVAMTEELASRLRRTGADVVAEHRIWVVNELKMTRSEPELSLMGPMVVALGGGHGLAASLEALRRITQQLTAIVTVADNGGSSGRLREEFGVLPPGDLRMALAALCGDDRWGQTWARVLQHRFQSSGDLNGHSVGNVLIVALWELLHDQVEGLDWIADLLDARGRVLPMSKEPLEITAVIEDLDSSEHSERVKVIGQAEVATSTGRVCSVALEPADPPACGEALEAVAEADWVVMGPGSWYTSVIPHLLVPQLRAALTATPANLILTMNLEAHTAETRGFDTVDHLRVIREYAADLQIHTILVDPSAVGDEARLVAEAADVGASLLVADVSSSVAGVHDPEKLALAYTQIMASP